MRIKLGRILVVLSLICFYSPSIAQDWVEKMQNPEVNFYEVQKAFNTYWEGKEIGRPKRHRQEQRLSAKQSCWMWRCH